MEKDGGLDDLFGALGDEESREPTQRTDETPESDSTAPRPTDPSAALNAAFIQAATEPIEPLVPAAAADPVESAPEPIESSESSESPESPLEDSHPALLPAMTRRELRERQRSGETGAIGVAGGVAAAPEPPEVPDAAEPEGFVPFAGVEAHEPASSEISASSEPSEPSEPSETAETSEASEAPEPSSPILEVERIEAPESTDDQLVDPALAALTTPTGSTAPASTQGAEPLVVSSAPRQQSGRGFPIRLDPAETGGARKRPWWLFWAVPLMVIVLLLGYVGVYLFTHTKEPGWNILGVQVPTAVEEKVRELLGWEIPNDYEGTGNGEEAIVTILPGDFGNDIAIALHAAGVTKSFDAFHDLLLELGATGQEPSFMPGNYSLQKEMSAQSALDALLDPANRIANRVIIPEGSTLPSTLAILAGQSGLPLEEFTAAAADLSLYGLPPGAVSLEGYLFPAAYDLDGTESAVSLLQRLVAETFARLDALGVAPENRNAFLTLASIVQGESGPSPEDPPKIARVFQNRLDQGMLLESDATTTYGTCVWGPSQGLPAPDTCGSVFINQSDIDDASNPYNTRAVAGLPPGPIGMPGQASLDAVANPADGPWIFFVTVNLATGETVFTETNEQHEAAVDQLYAWCEASDENASYCA